LTVVEFLRYILCEQKRLIFLANGGDIGLDRKEAGIR